MRIKLIRHGESAANAGMASVDPGSIPLTELGWGQARQLAAAWTEAPDLVIMSPFLRTQQTARPTLDRFPASRFEEWPVQEFTYLAPSRYAGTTYLQRLPAVRNYWQAADAEAQDGPDAESFAMLLRRVEAFVARFAELSGGLVLVFTHQQFIQALRLTLEFPQRSDQEKMAAFLEFDQAHPLPNCAVIDLPAV